MLKHPHFRLWGGLLLVLSVVTVFFFILQPLAAHGRQDQTQSSSAKTSGSKLTLPGQNVSSASTPKPTSQATGSASGQKAVPCPAKQANCLSIFTSSYAGQGTSDTGNAVALAADGTLIIGGTIDGKGKIIRVAPAKNTLLSQTPLGTTITDLEITPGSGSIVASGDTGLTVLNAQGKVLWSNPVGSKSANRRVAVGADGTIAALAGSQVTLFNQSGKQLGQFPVAGSTVNDLAIHTASGTVVAVGFSQKDGGPCSQLQVPFMRAYGYNGKVKWSDYDLSHAATYAANQSCADSRANRVIVGPDQKIYMLGTSFGGNTIYRYSPKNASLSAPVAKPDPYSDPYNTSSAPITFIGKYDLQGNLLHSTNLLTRNKAKGNAVTPAAIGVDAAGNIYVGGSSAYLLANHDQLTISGVKVGTYVGYEGFLAIYNPDLTQRKVWTTWTGTNSGSSLSASVNSIAVANGRVALVEGTKQNMILVNPMQKTKGTGNSAFYAVLPTIS